MKKERLAMLEKFAFLQALRKRSILIKRRKKKKERKKHASDL